MAFTMPNFPILTPEQANPFTAALSSALSTYGKTQDFQKAAQDIQKSIYQNMLEQQRSQYYPRLAKAEMLQAEAQPGLTTAQTGLYGAQAQSAQVLAQKNQQLMDILSKWLARKNLREQQPNITNTNKQNLGISDENEGKTLLPTQIHNKSIISQQAQIPSEIPYGQNEQGMEDYALSAIVSHQLGLSQPHFISDPSSGIEYAIMGTGEKIPLFKGLSAKQQAFQQGLGKSDADAYTDLSNQVSSLQNQDIAYDQLIEGLNNPEFFNTVGPVRSYLLRWGAGNKQRQELLGKLQSSSGEIELAVAPMLKGSFAKFEDDLIKDTKPSPKDNPYIYMGKLKSQMIIKKVLKERAKIAADLIYNGMPRHKAIEEAAKKTPLEPYKKQINELIDPVIPIVNKKTKEIIKMKISEARAKGIKGV